MKQTAVEWLKEQIECFGNKHELQMSWATLNYLFNQAKEMEKSERAQEYLRGYNDAKQFDNLLDDLQNH